MNHFITITGYKHYYGLIPFSIGATFSLSPEPDNLYDEDAVAVVSPIYGKVGYVANQKDTMAEGTEGSALCKNHSEVIVRFIAGDYIIAEITS